MLRLTYLASGRSSRDYACGLKRGDAIPTPESLSHMFGCFFTTNNQTYDILNFEYVKLQYFDLEGLFYLSKGLTGGRQGDPLEMLVFCITIHHLWGRVLTKFPEDRTVANGDDGYIKTKLSVSLQVLVEMKRILKEDTGLELNVVKTSVLPKGISQQEAVDVGTDVFVHNFVGKTCRTIIDDVEKLDVIQDDCIHYQLVRFCQVTRLQYINSHILLGNRFTLQHQHVDCKIVYTLLKKGTKHHSDGWDPASKTWSYMVLHLPHTDGGFGV